MNRDSEPTIKPSTFDNKWEKRLINYPNTKEFQEIYGQLIEELPLPEMKLPTPIVVSLIGIPGSGKSTFSSILQEKIPALHVRSDNIGLFRLPKGKDHDYYKAYVIQHALARYYLAQGYSVIMDDNNRTRYNREKVYKMAQEFDAQTFLFFLQVSLDEALRRSDKRDIEEGRDLEFHMTRKRISFFQGQIEIPTSEELEMWNVNYKIIDANRPVYQIREILTGDSTIVSLANS